MRVRFHRLKVSQRFGFVKSNMCYGDFWARDWLDTHPDVLEAPVDKNIHSSLVSRHVYDKFAKVCLDRGFVAVSQNAALGAIGIAHRMFVDACSDAALLGVLSKERHHFLSCLYGGWAWPEHGF